MADTCEQPNSTQAKQRTRVSDLRSEDPAYCYFKPRRRVDHKSRGWWGDVRGTLGLGCCYLYIYNTLDTLDGTLSVGLTPTLEWQWKTKWFLVFGFGSVRFGSVLVSVSETLATQRSTFDQPL